MPAASYLFPFILACRERSEISWEVILVSLWTQTDFGGVFKIIQVYERLYDGANWKGNLNNTELFLKLFHIQSKEIGNNKYYEETTELEKWQSEISPEYWR